MSKYYDGLPLRPTIDVAPLADAPGHRGWVQPALAPDWGLPDWSPQHENTSWPLASLMSSVSGDWGTPPVIIERVRTFFDGAIDLDPASTPEHNETVRATTIYTEADDGLAHKWHVRTLWLNPPYGRVIGTWIDKLVCEYRQRRTQEALTLVPARTDTKWWGALADYPVCFIAGRLHFSGSKHAAPFPSALVYLGPDNELFCRYFAALGRCYTPVFR